MFLIHNARWSYYTVYMLVLCLVDGVSTMLFITPCVNTTTTHKTTKPQNIPHQQQHQIRIEQASKSWQPTSKSHVRLRSRKCGSFIGGLRRISLTTPRPSLVTKVMAIGKLLLLLLFCFVVTGFFPFLFFCFFHF